MGMGFFLPPYSIARLTPPHVALQINPISGRAPQAEHGRLRTAQQSPGGGSGKAPYHLHKGSPRSHSKRRARQVGNRPHSDPGKRGEGPWAPRLLEAAVPARGLGSAATGASCSPPATRCGEDPGAGAPQPGLRPAPCPPPRRHHRHRHGPSCIPWFPRTVEGYPTGFHAAAQLAPSKNKKTKTRQILWCSFLTPSHRRFFLSFSLFFVQLGSFFALVPYSQNTSNATHFSQQIDSCKLQVITRNQSTNQHSLPSSAFEPSRFCCNRKTTSQK